MALITCLECGKEVSDKATACPACGAPIKKNDVPSKKKKESILGVLGLISSLFMCWLLFAFVGFILCLLSIRKTEKSQNCAYVGLAISSIGLFLNLFVFSDESHKQNPSPVPLSNQESQEDNIIDCEHDGLHLRYLRHEIAQNYSGEECIAVYYEFTNNSKETTSYIYSFSDQAFQNGIELNKSLFLLENIEDNRAKDIRPGVSVEIYSLFVPSDNSVVEIEVSDFYSINNKPLDCMNLLIN